MALRFNPPPGWPAPPAGWVPPPGWQPDLSWPAPPPAWQFWVDDGYGSYPTSWGPGFPAQPQPPRVVTAAQKWGLGGALAVVVGSVLPFVSAVGLVSVDVPARARLVSGGFGGLLAVLAVLAMVSATNSQLFSALLLAGGALGGLGYTLFIVIGLAGIEEEQGDFLTYTTTVTYEPHIGIISCTVGCVVCAVAAIGALRGR